MSLPPEDHRASFRLAVFAPSLAAGGAERVTALLLAGLRERGVDVTLVLARACGRYLKELPEGVPVVDLRTSRVFASVVPLARYLRTARPDVLLSVLGHANVAALLSRKLVRVPVRVFVSEHTTLSRYARRSGGLRDAALPWFARLLYPTAEGIIAVSHGVAGDLARVTGVPEHRIHVINNPVVSPRWHQAAQAEPDHPWFSDGGPPIILAAGRLVRAKDYPTMLRGFALVSKERPARLLVLGEGPERLTLDRLICDLGLSDRVALPGEVANPYPYMRKASVFVVSSAWEGFGNVLVEAMACGCPVVSTDCPSGPREILAGGRYGALVPVGDHVALAEAILRTLDDRPDVSDAQRHAQEFSVERAVERYLEVLRG